MPTRSMNPPTMKTIRRLSEPDILRRIQAAGELRRSSETGHAMMTLRRVAWSASMEWCCGTDTQGEWSMAELFSDSTPYDGCFSRRRHLRRALLDCLWFVMTRAR